VILCYLEGHSTAEAAALLGCPRGTVLSRLATARQRLAGRLLRRGVTLSLAAVTARLVDCAGAAVPALVVKTTCAAVLGLAAGKAAGGIASARAVLLMEGVLRNMFLSKVKVVLLLAVVVLLAGFGLSRWALPGSNKAEAYEKVGGEVVRTPVRESEPRKAPEEEPRSKDERAEARALPPQRPIGNWERQFGPLQITLRIKADRLIGIVDMAVEKQRINFVFEGDYSVTRDGVLYGIVTGIDFQGAGQGELKELAEFQLISNRLVDQPFSIRYRVDDGVLTIKDVKFGSLGLKEEKDELAEMKAMAVGRYRQSGAGGKERPW
jgi:hypothetical protein